LIFYYAPEGTASYLDGFEGEKLIFRELIARADERIPFLLKELHSST
jgi:hypothetical protein